MFTISRIFLSNFCKSPARVRFYCTPPSPPPPSSTPTSKPSLFSRLKSMYKDYWYVTIPVHVVTSCVWMGGFYEAARSGLDLGKYMRYMGFSDAVIDKVAGTGAGNLAVAYALYKIATPARYAVTLGSATYTINVLKQRGIIKTAKEISQPARDIITKRKDKFLNKNVKSPPNNHNSK